MENENSVAAKTLKMDYILQKEILTLEEACMYLGISASFMYKLTSGRLIPHYVPSGKLIYFKRAEVDEWVLHNKRSSMEEIHQESIRFTINSDSKKSNR